jgi:uncharacterized protein (TIGR00730 family)
VKSVCVFCGSRAGTEPAYEETALDVGGEVVGVIPKTLLAREIAHTGLTDLRVVGSMHERKALMSELSEGFVALPGSTGTLEEFIEVLTWAQLGVHRKPCGLLNVDGYYEPLLTVFDHMVETGFLSEEHQSMVLVETEPKPLLEALTRNRPPEVPKWIGRAET